MKEQLINIADALDGSNLDWNCTFHINKQIGEYTYDITIARTGSKLELTAKLPIRLFHDDYSEWGSVLKKANEGLKCGMFLTDSGDNRVCYQVYSLYSREGEVKDSETVKKLLECCWDALENHTDGILALLKKKSPIDAVLDFLNPFGDNKRKDS